MPASDDFQSYPNGLTAPAVKDEAVVPSDTVDLAKVSRGLYVGTGGHVALLLAGSAGVKTYKNVAAGTFLPFRVRRVYATNTTAADMIALQ